MLTVGPDRIEVLRAGGEAQTSLVGKAHDLYLLLWNRGPAEAVDVEGDETFLARWRESVTVRW